MNIKSLFSNKKEALIKELDELEAVSVRFEADQLVDYSAYLKRAEQFPHEFRIQRRIIALQYRLESANGGLDTVAPDVSENARLRQMVVEWKAAQVLMPNKELTEDECARIQETVSYEKFLPLLEDAALRERFFIWTIRDKMSPSSFIQFPGMQKRIDAASLAGRIGRINGSFLKIKKIPTTKGIYKVMTLPMEGVDVNILDSKSSYTFRGEYRLTVQQIFEVFENKHAHAGNLEFLAEGIINWNYLKMGWYNAKTSCYHIINVHQKNWWRNLPVFEIIKTAEAKARYGNHVDGKIWNVAAGCSRSTATLDYERTHAYLDFAIPLGSDQYAIYDFGKFANEFPTTLKETLDMFALNVHASVAYPDESVYYTHREHTYYSFPMRAEQAHQCMNSIAEDVLVSRAENFVYQIESDNCAKWAQEKIEAAVGADKIPNLFQIHLLATEPTGPVSYIFNCLKKLPQSLRTFALTRLHLPLGAGKGTWIVEAGQRVYKSLANHEFYDTGLIYLPAFLHRQQEMGLLGKVIDFFEQIVYQVTERRSFKRFAALEVMDESQGFLKNLIMLLEKLIQARKRTFRVLIPQFVE